jgi:glutathione S-transferase
LTDEPALQLYGYWRSMAAYRVRVGLSLKGIHAQDVPINLEAGEQLAPEFLAVNPEGAVPTLIEFLVGDCAGNSVQCDGSRLLDTHFHAGG